MLLHPEGRHRFGVVDSKSEVLIFRIVWENCVIKVVKIIVLTGNWNSSRSSSDLHIDFEKHQTPWPSLEPFIKLIPRRVRKVPPLLVRRKILKPSSFSRSRTEIDRLGWLTYIFQRFSKGPTISNGNHITQLLNIHNIFLLYISSHYTINQGRTKETSCKKPVSPFKLMSNLRQICYFSLDRQPLSSLWSLVFIKFQSSGILLSTTIWNSCPLRSYSNPAYLQARDSFLAPCPENLDQPPSQRNNWYQNLYQPTQKLQLYHLSSKM